MATEPKSVPLGDLRENDYNPRQRLDPEHIEDLRESIRKNGLIQPLAVREVDDGYEVISGERRLHALRELYEADHPVPVNLLDVDRREAALLALTENMEREDLTVIEEAWGFARQVDVDVDGETQSYADVVSEIYTNSVRIESLHFTIPSDGHSGVQELAEKVSPSAKYIAQRLSFLILPPDVREMVERGDLPKDERDGPYLTKRAARMIVRLANPNSKDYGIEDFPTAVAAMRDVAEKYSGHLSNGDYADVKEAVAKKAENWDRKKDIIEDDIENYAELVDERAEELKAKIEDVAAHLGREVTLSGDVDELLAEADAVAETLSDARDGVAEQRDAVSKRRSEAEREAMRAGQALTAHEGEGECPYCGSDVTIEYLKERVEELQGTVTSAESALGDLSKRESELRDLRTAVKTTASSLSDAVGQFREARERAEQFVGVPAGDD